MRNWIPVITTGLAVFFLIMWVSKCDAPETKPDDSEEWRQRVETLEMHTNIRDNIIDSLQRVIATLKKEHVTSSEKLTKVATVNFNRYKRAVAEVQHLRDSFPQVNTLVLAADSVIASKDSLYNAEISSRYMAEKLYEQTIQEMADHNIVQKQISELQATKIIDLEKDKAKLARKLQRKRTGNRVLLGIGAGLATAIGILTLTQ